MSKVLPKRGFGSLPSSTETNPRDHVKLISTIVEANSSSICLMGSSQYAVSTRQNRTLIKEKDPGSFTLPCFINNVFFDNALADLGASIRVMPLLTYLNLGLGELAHTRLTVELADRTVKHPKGIVENMLVARLMGETLVLNRSLDSFFEDYIELNDLNVPLELRRNQVYDLMPTFKEGEILLIVMKEWAMLFLANRFTIQNGNEEVTYQMVRSHPRFKHHTNEQCNKIPPLLKVSEEDKMNGISHSYKKLKRLYKGILNLGHDFIGVPSMEEWLTRRTSMEKEIGEVGEVGEVSIIWNLMCDCNHVGRYGVSVLALTKDHEGMKINTPYLGRPTRRIQAIWE
ncbi:hypothetical protein Tco_1361969 [Tanacetum coccineum]